MTFRSAGYGRRHEAPDTKPTRQVAQCLFKGGSAYRQSGDDGQEGCSRYHVRKDYPEFFSASR
jgi:hypothetical protein